MPFFVVAKIETDQSPLTCPAPRNKSKVSVGDRIQQLESMVRSLAQQQQSPQQQHIPQGTLGTSPQGLSTTTPLASVDEDNVAPAMRHASLSHNRDYPTSPAPSEHGSIRLHSNGANYVGSFHWAAVLDSISELRDHYEEEEEARLLAANDHVLHESPGPRLLYEPVQTTKADLLAAIPAQPAVDRMVARDSEIGLWLVQGMLVQLALSLGYHPDPQNFSSISPFAGEMRRRVWAVIVQMDLRLSSQMALPRLLKLQQYDTAEPRNLLDTDFDENTTELPESRPETEVTPVLYSLARTRIDQMNGLVSDLVNDTREHPYAEIIDLDRKLQEAEASLSPIFRWQPLSQSFMVLPQIVMHRVLLQLAIQRVTVWLHRKYLTPSYYNPAQFEYSRKACIKSAMRILEFQQIVDEETQKDGLLYPVRWMFTSSRLNAVFLLGISILCYYVQLTRTHPDVSLGEQTDNSINDLLQNVYPLWLRLSAISPGARRVVQLLHPLLGMDGQENDQTPVATPNSVSPFPVSRDMMSLDQPAWEPYEDSIVNFSSMPTFPNSVDFRYSDGLMSSSTTAVVSMADLLLTNTTEFDQWMNVSFH
ncbi:hypothetical protein PDIDSM_480 [Penicillium digitatum]|nr:hypothetical protein PDIDSM_480 [Penicillium digitatum]